MAAPRAEVGPHDYTPLRRFLNGGRCSACYRHEAEHPIRRWVAARPYGDRADALPPHRTANARPMGSR